MKRYFSLSKFVCLFLFIHYFISMPMVNAVEDHEITPAGILFVEEDDGTVIESESKFPENKTYDALGLDNAMEERIHANVSLKTFYSDIAGNIDSNGSKISLGRDTGLSQKVRFAGQGEVLFSNGLKLQLEYLKIDESSNTNKPLTFDGLTYSLNSNIKLSTDLYDLGIAAKINPEIENSTFTFLLLGGAKLKRLDLKLEEKTTAVNQVCNLDQNYTLPYLGLMSDIKLSDTLNFNSSVKYLALNKKGTSTRLSDLKALFIHRFNSTASKEEMQLNIAFGYRYLLVHSKTDDNSSELVLSGPTFGIEASF